MEGENRRENHEEPEVQEDESGWKLYYSEEGYPYYFNEVTGDSRWADYQEDHSAEYQYNETYDQNNYDYSYQNNQSGDLRYQDPHYSWNQNVGSIDEEAIQMKSKENSRGRNAQGRDDDDEDEEEGFDGDEDSEDESSDSEDEAELDRKFKEYLRTPEGMAAVLYEQERIERQVGLHQERQSVHRDAEYVKGLLLSKKSDDYGRESSQGRNRVVNKPMNVFESIRDGFNVYLKGLIDPSEKAAKIEEKLKRKAEKADLEAKSQSKPSRGRRIKLENSQVPVNNISTTVVEEDEETGNADQSVSKSSSSSDLVSLSSNDSDVAVINTPVFGEFTPLFSRFYQSYIEPTRQYLDQAGITENTITAANMVLVGGRYVAYNVAVTTYSIATGLVNIGGTLLQHGLAATGEQLYPHLVTFMENFVDGGNITPTRRILSSSSAIISEVSNSNVTTIDVEDKKSEITRSDDPILVLEENINSEDNNTAAIHEDSISVTIQSHTIEKTTEESLNESTIAIGAVSAEIETSDKV